MLGGFAAWSPVPLVAGRPGVSMGLTASQVATPVDGVRSFKASGLAEDYLAVLKTHRLKRREPLGPRANIVSLDIDIPDSVFLVAGTCPSLRGIRRSIPVV